MTSKTTVTEQINEWLNLHPYVRTFDDLKVTTMTLIMALNGHINHENAFALLPITPVQPIAQKKKTKKCKLPDYPIPGHILSIRNGGITRGLVRSSGTTHFRNNVTLDISTSVKNISVKLSASTLQMCGAKSIEIGTEAAEHIFNHLHRIQERLDMISNNPELCAQVIEWYKEYVKGPEIERVCTTLHDYDKMQIQCEERFIDYEINRDAKVDESMLSSFSDPSVAKEICDFCSEQLLDFKYILDFYSKLEWILTSPPVINQSPLSIKNTQIAMYNCNYNIGFSIIRSDFAAHFNTVPGFSARYDNSTDNNVAIEHSAYNSGNRRGKSSRHTFLVYRGGNVTQSGKGGQEMADMYYKFIMEAINNREKYEDVADDQSVIDYSSGVPSPTYLSSPLDDQS